MVGPLALWAATDKSLFVHDDAQFWAISMAGCPPRLLGKPLAKNKDVGSSQMQLEAGEAEPTLVLEIPEFKSCFGPRVIGKVTFLLGFLFAFASKDVSYYHVVPSWDFFPPSQTIQ